MEPHGLRGNCHYMEYHRRIVVDIYQVLRYTSQVHFKLVVEALQHPGETKSDNKRRKQEREEIQYVLIARIEENLCPLLPRLDVIKTQSPSRRTPLPNYKCRWQDRGYKNTAVS